MKIFQVLNNLDCGGLEKVTLDLCLKLKAHGHDVTICCLEGLGNLFNNNHDGIEIIALNKKSGFDVRLPFRLAGAIRQRRPDIVHTHNLGPLVYGTLGAKFAGIPVIVNTRHGREDKRTYGFLWNMNDAVVAISKDARRRLLVFNRLNHAKSKVIYNGINPASSLKTDTSAIKERIFGIDPKCKILGTVSRLSEEKDQITLLDAFLKVSQAVKDARIVFVGDGPLRQALRGHSEKLGIADKVIFLGFRKDAAEIVGGFDIFVLPSLTEGISLSLLEAMAAGKPVVVTNVGGNPEVAVDEVTGFLVPPKAPGALAKALITLLGDDVLSKRMGEAGRQRVEEQFSIDRMVREYEELYGECLSSVGCRTWGVGCL